MLKPLIVILILVFLLAIGLNVDFSTPPINNIPSTHIKSTKESVIVETNITLSEENTTQASSKVIDNNLSIEIQALFNKARNHFQNNQDEEAQNIYSLIITKVQDKNEVTFLKYFAKAYKQKAFLFKIYPTYDKESAIEMLEIITKKFEDSEDFELIELYINAKIEMAFLQTKEDSLEAYDELLKKFRDRTEPYFQKKVEDLLLEKSFALMGEDDEEAMEILDELISKYQKLGEKTLPDTIKSSILNNIELAIITNNDDSNYRELADTYMNDSPDKAPLLDMLDIIRNSQDLNQDDALKAWQENHNSYRFPDWSFDELRKWAYRIEDKETKERVSQYIDVFENHKYSISATKNTVTYDETGSISKNEDSTDSDGGNDSTPPEEEIIYETQAIEYSDSYATDTPVVEDDPYINDIPPVLYEDPYATEEDISYEELPEIEENQEIIYEPIEH